MTRPWKVADAGRGIDGEGDDLLRRVRGHGLDVDAAFGRGDEGDAARAAIDQQRKVELAGDGCVLNDIDAADDATLGPGLRSDERLAQHAVGLGVQLLQRLHQLDAAAFTATAGMDLRLDHEGLAAEGSRVRGGLLRGLGDVAFGHRRAVSMQQRLGLIFVNVHGRCRGR